MNVYIHRRTNLTYLENELNEPAKRSAGSPGDDLILIGEIKDVIQALRYNGGNLNDALANVLFAAKQLV